MLRPEVDGIVAYLALALGARRDAVRVGGGGLEGAEVLVNGDQARALHVDLGLLGRLRGLGVPARRRREGAALRPVEEDGPAVPLAESDGGSAGGQA